MLVVATVMAAISALGGDMPVVQPRITIPFDRFMVGARLPAGWSIEEGQVLPPMALRSACHVHGVTYGDRDWNRMLVTELDPGNVLRSSKERRVLSRIGGHVAINNQYTDLFGKRIEYVYIDLADLETGSVAVWSFEGDDTAGGRRCKLEFGMFIAGASFELRSQDPP
jgi:hypothetical protein